jgi:hypothetical protein
MLEKRLVYPNVKDFDKFSEFLNYILETRDFCYKRGYHRIESEPKTKDEVLICYDCIARFNEVNLEGEPSLGFKVEKIEENSRKIEYKKESSNEKKQLNSSKKHPLVHYLKNLFGRK